VEPTLHWRARPLPYLRGCLAIVVLSFSSMCRPTLKSRRFVLGVCQFEGTPLPGQWKLHWPNQRLGLIVDSRGGPQKAARSPHPLIS
jgi:hypothetical protein